MFGRILTSETEGQLYSDIKWNKWVFSTFYNGNLRLQIGTNYDRKTFKRLIIWNTHHGPGIEPGSNSNADTLASST